MNKFLISGLALAVGISLAGCSDDNAKGQETDANTNKAAVEQTEKAAGDVSQYNQQIDDLKPLVDQAIQKADKAVPTGTAEEKNEQFTALEKELDDVDKKLDQLEDLIEADEQAGKITLEQANELEQALDELDAKLDESEEKMEQAFRKFD